MIGDQLSIFDVELPTPMTDDDRIDQWVEWAWEKVKHLPKELQLEIVIRLQTSCYTDKIGSATKARLATVLLQTLE